MQAAQVNEVAWLAAGSTLADKGLSRLDAAFASIEDDGRLVRSVAFNEGTPLTFDPPPPTICLSQVSAYDR
jgi:hypothetical protein